MQADVSLPGWAQPYIAPAPIKVAYGGRGSAKSWTVARILLLRAAQSPMRALCGREFQNSIRESVHQLLRDQIEHLRLPGFTVLEQEIRHRTGSLFIFKGLHANVHSVKSTEAIDVCWVEEAELVSAESWRVLIPTVNRKPGSEIWVTFNPRFETDPTYQQFVAHPPPRAVVRKVSWRDNPWFSSDQREHMEHLYKVNPDEAEHVYGGEFARRSQASVLGGKYNIEAFTPGENWDGPYFGSDWGFSNDPSTLVRMWLSPDKSLFIEYEAGGVGLSYGETERMFDTVPGSRDYTIRADESRPESIHEMRRRGFKIVASPKGKGSVEDGITWLQSRPRITIHPRCRETANEARLWSYKTDRLTGDPLPILADGNDHYWDAIRYAMQPMIRVRTWRPL